jgi:hypothetical protein
MASPLPLYSGITLAVFHEAGGAVAMALSLRNVAKLPIPAFPRNFRSCGGSRLLPRLFVALYLCCSTPCNSAAVINSVAGLSSALYLSSLIVLS